AAAGGFVAFVFEAPGGAEGKPFGCLGRRLLGQRQQEIELLESGVSLSEFFGQNARELLAFGNVVRIGLEFFGKAAGAQKRFGALGIGRAGLGFRWADVGFVKVVTQG